ncbi:hypothetical protein [Maribacter forsetii]|uniref:hypothetical protein n=1 Tax=Maribacter forsetii TaxID=444515 RepID=UPI000561F1B3|nr:hypothetical protein [Maribacter forsetii]
MKFKHKIIFAIFTCIVIVSYLFSTITEGEYYRLYSPDGQYSVYASRDKYFNFIAPFEKFSDAGGRIHVYDELENKPIGSSSIDMISNINELFWSEEELYSKGSMNSIQLPRKISSKIINKYDSSLPNKHSWNLFIQGKKYKVYETSNNRLNVSDENEKILLEDIAYISQITNGFQVLTKNTEIKYYDPNLNKLKKAPDSKIIHQEECGNVTTYNLKIEEKDKFYIIKKAIGFTNYSSENYIVIDSLNKEKIKDTYFLNKKRELAYDENSQQEEIIFLNFDSYTGVWSEKYGIEYFDSIDLESDPIKVMRDNLMGYYNTTPTTFLKLDPFEFNLAKFEKDDANGEKKYGYVDRNGRCFYK